MKIENSRALIVEGGAMRGIFASGVLDAFMDANFQPYDFAIGVSAGASNLLGYIANQPGRSYHVITELATQKKFFSPARFIKGGDLVDIQWLWTEANKQFPIDQTDIFHSIPFWATVTDVRTGKANYHRISPANIQDAMIATAALPIAFKHPPCFSGGCYTDGGVADSIPVKEAYRRGARDITVILSHPLNYQMPKARHPWLINKLLTPYPKIADAMAHRADNYNASLAFIRNPPEGTIVRVIAPPDMFSVKRLTMDTKQLNEGYIMGMEAGRQHIAALSGKHGLSDENCHFCL